MEKACIGFEMASLDEAWEHMTLEVVEEYGDQAYGNILHTWDDGERKLARCRKCGGYVLIQKSEFHSFSEYSDDGYYTDYFPVKGPVEADMINRKYSGFALEANFPTKYICSTNCRIHWSRN